MPTDTFFRLPEEKQARLIDAAWEEFTRVTYSEVSINKIILKAHIPRGSFYQYFSDKQDLFTYLCHDLYQYLSGALESALRSVRGDLFAAMLQLYDQFCQSPQQSDLPLLRAMNICRLNPGLNLTQITHALPCLLPEPVWSLVDTSQLRKKSSEDIKQLLILLGLTTITTVRATVAAPEEREAKRQVLLAHIDIIKHGCLSSDIHCNKEESKS